MPNRAQVGERDMLRLDDELAGLIEAADMPAAQVVAHLTKREAASPVPGELALVHMMSAAAPLEYTAELRQTGQNTGQSNVDII